MNIQPHIQLSSSINCKKAIIVGDPKRVDLFKPYINGKDLVFNREYKSVLGTYNGENILIISTGIGAPSATICVEELSNIGIDTIVRIGSCGAMQKNIKIGDIIIANGVVRDDGITTKYVPLNYPAIPSIELLVKAEKFFPNGLFGLVRSHDGFYMDDNDEVQEYWSKFGIIGADMESGALMVVGALRKIKTLSILVNVVNYQEDLKEGINSFVDEEKITMDSFKVAIENTLKILTTKEK